MVTERTMNFNMNNKIKELIIEANPSSKEIYESDSWQFNCAAWSAGDLQKFAELLIRECAKPVNNLYKQGGGTWGEVIIQQFDLEVYKK